MPRAKPSETQTAPDDAELPFEDAIERLEGIIGRMEGEQVPLEELLASYEEGTKLLKLCRSRIDAARLKVETINASLADRAEEIPSGGEASAADDHEDPDDEIQLL